MQKTGMEIEKKYLAQNAFVAKYAGLDSIGAKNPLKFVDHFGKKKSMKII